jgi:hypothetical protein
LFTIRHNFGTSTIGTTYADIRPPEKRFVKYVEALYGLGVVSWEARGGAGINLGKGWQLGGELQAIHLRELKKADGSIRLRLRKEF